MSSMSGVHDVRVHEVLRFAGETMIHLERGTYQWVSIKRFEASGDLADAELLAALISHPQYHDHYAGGDRTSGAGWSGTWASTSS
jgi:hypothetical protein